MARKDNAPVSIRIRLKYPDLDTFIEKYAANISQGGMFIQSRAPQPAGTALRFELLLADGSRLLKGEGKVIWVREYDAAHPTRVHGMGVKFLSLDEESQSMVSLILAHKGGRRGQKRKSPTQEVQALVDRAQTEEEEPEAESDQPEEPAEQPPTWEAQLEASRADEAKLEPEAQPEQPEVPEELEVPEVKPPASMRPSSPMAAALEAFDSGGDGVAVSLATAEQMLGELIEEAGITEAQVSASLSRALAAGPELAGLEVDGLDQLLAAEPPPVVDPAQAMEMLQRSLGAMPVVAPPHWEPPPVVTPAVADLPPEPASEEPVEQLAASTAPPQWSEEPVDEPAPPDLETTVPEDFDPSLLEAAAHVSRASHAHHTEQSFDLSEGSQPELGEEEVFASRFPTQEDEEPVPATDPGWKDVKTATEWLDHDSSRVLQDMAAKTVDGQQAAHDSDDGYHEPLGEIGPDEIEEAVTLPGLDDADEGAADDLSNEMWREVVQEAADVSDPGMVPISMADDGRAVEVDEDMVQDEDEDYYGEEDRTQVSAVPDFDGPGAFDQSRPSDDLFPASLDLENEVFDPPDPDLDNEVFDALAGLKEPSEPGEGPVAPIGTGEAIPSLDDLAEVAHQSVPPAVAAQPMPDLDGLHVIADDPQVEAPEAPNEIKPRKSGIFRRLFGKK